LTEDACQFFGAAHGYVERVKRLYYCRAGGASGDVTAHACCHRAQLAAQVRGSAIRTQIALYQGRPAPALDTEDLHQVIYTQFCDRDGQPHVDRLREQWLSAAREHGLAVEGGDGNLLPGVLDSTTHTVSEAICSASDRGM